MYFAFAPHDSGNQLCYARAAVAAAVAAFLRLARQMATPNHRQICVGDTLCWVGVEPNRMTRVEALDWDQTISALGGFTEDR